MYMHINLCFKKTSINLLINIKILTLLYKSGIFNHMSFSRDLCCATSPSIMKMLLLVLAVFGAASATSFSSGYYPMEETDSSAVNGNYLSYVKQSQALKLSQLVNKFERACPGKGDEFREAMVGVQECAEEINERVETMCSAFKNHFLRCSKPMIKLVEECLPDESKDIPNLLFQATASAVKYICKTDGEHILELANSCLMKPDSRLMRCTRRLKTKLQQYQRNSPTKSEICSLAKSLKPCLHDHLVLSCGNQITRESFDGLFDALVTPCGNDFGITSTGTEANLNEIEIELIDDNGV